MEPIHYFIIYCVGFVLSIVFYFWLNRNRPSYNYNNTEIPFGLSLKLSIFWPFILISYSFFVTGEVITLIWPTKLINRFTDWYEGK